jgi:hypothetical protein
MTALIDRRATFAMAFGATLAVDKAAKACTPEMLPPAGFTVDEMRVAQARNLTFPQSPDAHTLVDRMFAALAARDRNAFLAVFSPNADLLLNNSVAVSLATWFDRLGTRWTMFQGPDLAPKCRQVFFWGVLSARVEQDAASMCGPNSDYLIYRFSFSNQDWHDPTPAAYRISRLTIV